MIEIPDNLLCVIPARMGSQGIRKKNLRLLGGIPLVKHSILHALHAGIDPSRICVSSDGGAILDVARECKVVAHKRPDEISGAMSSTEETLLYVLESFPSYEHVLLLQATSPIRLENSIQEFINFYLQGHDSALTTTKFYNFLWYTEDGNLYSTYDPENRPMRQSLTASDYRYFDNGNMYLTSSKTLLETKCRLGGKVGVFPITELEGMQIDTEKDFKTFNAIFSGSMAQSTGVGFWRSTQ